MHSEGRYGRLNMLHMETSTPGDDNVLQLAADHHIAFRSLHFIVSVLSHASIQICCIQHPKHERKNRTSDGILHHSTP